MALLLSPQPAPSSIASQGLRPLSADETARVRAFLQRPQTPASLAGALSPEEMAQVQALQKMAPGVGAGVGTSQLVGGDPKLASSTGPPSGMQIPQGPVPATPTRPEPPLASQVGVGLSTAGQVADALGTLSVLPPGTGRTLTGAGQLVGASPGGVGQVLSALPSLVAPTPASTVPKAVAEPSIAEPAPALPAATSRPLSLSSAIGAGGTLLGAGGTIAELTGADPKVSGGLKAAGALASAAPAIAEIPKGGLKSLTGVGDLLEAAGGAATALGAEPAVSSGLTAAGRLTSGIPVLTKALTAPSVGTVLGGAGTALGIAGPVARALGAPPEVGFGLGQAGNILGTVGTGATIGGTAAGASAGSGLVGTGVGSLAGGVIGGAVAAPLAALSLSQFLEGIDRADEAKYTAKVSSRLLASYDRGNQGAYTLIPKFEAGDLSVLPKLTTGLEAAAYVSSRLTRNDVSDNTAETNLSRITAALVKAGRSKDAYDAIVKGTAWGGAGLAYHLYNKTVHAIYPEVARGYHADVGWKDRFKQAYPGVAIPYGYQPPISASVPLPLTSKLLPSSVRDLLAGLKLAS